MEKESVTRLNRYVIWEMPNKITRFLDCFHYYMDYIGEF